MNGAQSTFDHDIGHAHRLTSESGRSLSIVPRHMAEVGYLDTAHDDFQDGDPLKDIQDEVMRLDRGPVVVSHFVPFAEDLICDGTKQLLAT